MAGERLLYRREVGDLRIFKDGSPVMPYRHRRTAR